MSARAWVRELRHPLNGWDPLARVSGSGGSLDRGVKVATPGSDWRKEALRGGLPGNAQGGGFTTVLAIGGLLAGELRRSQPWRSRVARRTGDNHPMLSVIWSSQGEWFSTDASVVREVVPLIATRPMVGAPDWFAGLADHHGRLVPVLDADRLLGREPRAATLATRVLMLEVPCLGASRTIGLRVEGVRGIEKIDPRDPNGHGGLLNPEMPHLGEVVTHGDGTVQRVDLGRWLDGDRGRLLFGDDGTVSAPGDPGGARPPATSDARP